MERGRLRVYLGAAAGVGTTYAMIEEAIRRQARGTQVAIGCVETHGRTVTRQALERLTGGVDAPLELDVDSLIAARPDALPRYRVVVRGVVVRMRARPASGIPSLAVTITDDTGTVTAVWTGRRAIGGVTLGRRLAVHGVGRLVGDRLEFTNPAYELLP